MRWLLRIYRAEQIWWNNDGRLRTESCFLLTNCQVTTSTSRTSLWVIVIRWSRHFPMWGQWHLTPTISSWFSPAMESGKLAFISLFKWVKEEIKDLALATPQCSLKVFGGPKQKISQWVPTDFLFWFNGPFYRNYPLVWTGPPKTFKEEHRGVAKARSFTGWMPFLLCNQHCQSMCEHFSLQLKFTGCWNYANLEGRRLLFQCVTSQSVWSATTWYFAAW